MKCLLCKGNSEDEIILKIHYNYVHKINLCDWFFKAFFQKNLNNFFFRKCYRCDEIWTSHQQEQIPNFIKYYQQCGQIPLESKPIDKINIGCTIQKLSTEFEKHQNSYDFEDPIKLPEEFFNVFNIKFKTDGKKEFIFKSTFDIVNFQPTPELLPGGVAIYDKRIWSTSTYFFFFWGGGFNDFIKYLLISDIRKRIIINQETGSSWQFNRYDFVSMTINTVENHKKIFRAH